MCGLLLLSISLLACGVQNSAQPSIPILPPVSLSPLFNFFDFVLPPTNDLTLVGASIIQAQSATTAAGINASLPNLDRIQSLSTIHQALIDLGTSSSTMDELEIARLLAMADLLRTTGTYIAAAGAIVQATGFAINARVSMYRWQRLLAQTANRTMS